MIPQNRYSLVHLLRDLLWHVIEVLRKKSSDDLEELAELKEESEDIFAVLGRIA
jgi:hypothetical protein